MVPFGNGHLLVVGTQSVETTIVRNQNMQICHPLRSVNGRSIDSDSPK